MVDPSWYEDSREGICTWTIDEKPQVKLILTTYARDGVGTADLGRCRMHLYPPEHGFFDTGAYHSHGEWHPYDGNESITFGLCVGGGKSEEGEEMVDYYLAGQEWRENDYLVATGKSFMIELIYPKNAKVNGTRDLIRNITESVQWNPAETTLDSIDLGCTKAFEVLDVKPY